MSSLRNIRKQLGLTQADLAAQSGLRQATISALEAGRTDPHPGTIQSLAAAMSLDENEIRAAISASKPMIIPMRKTNW